MIIGHGDIASVLKDRRGFLFFASGVSNSQEIDENEYRREVDLLLSQPRDLRLVYISSLAIFEKDTRYLRHKRYMETLIKNNFPAYNIVRIGNITWGTNPHTLINGFVEREKRGVKPKFDNEFRYMVDKEEFLYWVKRIPEWNCEMNITGQRLKVKDVYERYVKVPAK